MDAETEQMTAELAKMLASNDRTRLHVDPRAAVVRFHHIKAAGRSAAHCYESFQSDGDDSLAKRLGSGTHAILLGQRVVLWDQPAKSGKGKAKRDPRSEAWTSFQLQHAGATILNRKEWDEAHRMADAIRANEVASRILFLAGTKYEETVLWQDGKYRRRSTPDVTGPGASFVAEIKTTKCASPAIFKYDVRRFGYHAQLADQAAALEAATGRKPRDQYIIAVEKSRPYVVQAYRLTPRDMDQGSRLLRSWWESFRVAAESNAWFGYSQTIMDLDLPDDQDVEFTYGADPDDEEDRVEASDE
jgi:hypothetical protein